MLQRDVFIRFQLEIGLFVISIKIVGNFVLMKKVPEGKHKNEKQHRAQDGPLKYTTGNLCSVNTFTYVLSVKFKVFIPTVMRKKWKVLSKK